MTIQACQRIFQGQFWGYVWAIPLYIVKIENVLMDNDGMVKSSPIGEEANLARANNGTKVGFDHVDNDFSD